MDAAILAQATAYGLAFTFGLFQTVLKQFIVSEWKAFFFVILATLVSTGLYYGLKLNLEILYVLIPIVSAAYGFTGSVDFYKNDIKPTI